MSALQEGDPRKWLEYRIPNFGFRHKDGSFTQIISPGDSLISEQEKYFSATVLKLEDPSKPSDTVECRVRKTTPYGFPYLPPQTLYVSEIKGNQFCPLTPKLSHVLYTDVELLAKLAGDKKLITYIKTTNSEGIALAEAFGFKAATTFSLQSEPNKEITNFVVLEKNVA